MNDQSDPTVMRHRHLEQIAMAALESGRLLMETGAKSTVVATGMRKAALGLGAEQVHTRIGYASLSLTVTHGHNTISRMIGVGHHRVDMRLNHAVRSLCTRVEQGGLTPQDVSQEIRSLTGQIPHHKRIVATLAAGLACAAFGRLLGTDWISFVPILAASAVAQGVRMALAARGTNTFVLIAVVALVASGLAGLGAMWVDSGTIGIAMTAAVLLLVPGVPSMNAQTDIMEGYPTMGSARFVTVAMILIFITVGMGAARMIVGPGLDSGLVPPGWLVHQAAFGALAAACFGVLFNFGARTLVWAAAAGGLALAARTLALESGLPLEAASFLAAVAVAVWVELLGVAPLRIRHAGQTLAVAGCIPMVPGGAAAQCIIGLLQLSSQPPAEAQAALVASTTAGLQVVFTLGAIGAGLTMVRSVVPHRDFP
ncbi:threonine/serine exporter family protein [Rhodovibrio salinarum]|uniref:threonine/serine exporter family protein n=1 Tax=Rhodovibrio salinarum TaxID=1087 RepID=UPI0004B0E226|nr:threonine/serine exporter family protein [Rhodovibrio salinarum]